jgi:hypothetical protein
VFERVDGILVSHRLQIDATVLPDLSVIAADGRNEAVRNRPCRMAASLVGIRDGGGGLGDGHSWAAEQHNSGDRHCNGHR